MKFLAALLASASAAATAKTACASTVSYYAKDDTDCSSTATDDKISVLIGSCNWSAAKSKWFKISKCTTYTLTMEWYGDDDECATAPTKLDKVEYTSTGVCTKAALTSTDEVGFYTQTAKEAATIADAVLCDFTFKAFSDGSDTCTTADDAETTKIG